MPEYRIYCIADDHRILKQRDCIEADDLDAIENGQRTCGLHEVEVWQRNRLVARLTRDGKQVRYNQTDHRAANSLSANQGWR